MSFLSSTTVAIIALGINLSPFVSKIISAGINNIEGDYLDAARAFGYKQSKIFWYFKIPLIYKQSMQPLLVQWYTTIKLSSLASVIGVTEVLNRSQQVIYATYQTEHVYMILAVCYMLIVIPIALLADLMKNKVES